MFNAAFHFLGTYPLLDPLEVPSYTNSLNSFSIVILHPEGTRKAKDLGLPTCQMLRPKGTRRSA